LAIIALVGCAASPLQAGTTISAADPYKIRFSPTKYQRLWHNLDEHTVKRTSGPNPSPTTASCFSRQPIILKPAPCNSERTIMNTCMNTRRLLLGSVVLAVLFCVSAARPLQAQQNLCSLVAIVQPVS
jgi:hypothetical protein